MGKPDKHTDHYPSPPRLGRWLLERSCPGFLYEEVRGDLDELYQRRLEESGKWKACFFYTWEAITSVRLRQLNPKKPSHNYDKDHLAMIAHYLKIGLRTLRKHKAYNFINIGGLAVGLACCLMIALYVQHELSYDRWMADSEHIYRVPMEISSEGNTRKFSAVAGPVGPTLENDFTQVENSLRLWQRPTRLVRLPGGQMFYEEGVYYAEDSFFNFFTLSMREGDPSTALTRPNTVVISESTASRYFGSRSALGQTLSINDTDFEVTGVMQDTPENTHHDFNMLMSLSTLDDNYNGLTSWHWTIFYTYVKLHPDTDTKAFARRIEKLADNYVEDELHEQKQEYRYQLQPVTDIHLYSDYGYEAKAGGSATAVYIFSIVAAMVLLIACLNFVNLATARSEIRAKEVGMRKVVGAYRSSLVGQFLGEALMLSFLSLVVAIAVFSVVLPWYNLLVGVQFGLEVLQQPEVIGALLSVTLIVGLCAGFYPAIVLSSFSPLSMFHGRSGGTGRGSTMRKVMVVGQFAISVVLIAGTITVYKQLNFMLNKDLGIRTEQMLALPIRGNFDLENKYSSIKDGFGSLAAVENVTLSSTVPGRGADNYAIRIDREQNDMTQSMYHIFVEYDFTETYGLEIVAGRDFSQEYGNDLGETFLINEEAVKSFGWSSPEEAIGQVLQTGAGGFKAEIVGVFKNFHYRAVDQTVEPLVLNIQGSALSTVTLRLNTEELSGTLDQVQAQWATLFPDKAFDYFFVDEALDQQYDSYERTGNILLTFSILAILIACLGLYGLAAFSAQQRTKEIGIRKVLGATVSSLTLTVSKDFLKLVAIAVAVAIPTAWWLAVTWLEQFAYRIDPGIAIFSLAGLAAIGIALLTVSWQSVRAARVNPVESLRSE